MSEEQGKNSPLERCRYFYEGARDSINIRIFIYSSAFAILGYITKLHKLLLEAGWVSERTISIGLVVYVVIVCFAGRTFFILGEQTGRTRERNKTLELEMESHVEAYNCLHTVIHRTRDTLFRNGAFQNLAKLDDAGRTQSLYQLIENQLGMLELAMRKLSRADCNIVLKVVVQGVCDGKPGLVSACYGPSTLIERRDKSTTLPVNQGIVHSVIVTKRIVSTTDILTDDRFFPHDRRAELSKRYRTIAACPIIVNGEVVAVLCFDWKEPGKYDEKKYSQLLACFTDLLSQAFYVNDEARRLTSGSVAQHHEHPRKTEGEDQTV